MFKKVLTIVPVAVLAVMVAGCGSGKDAEPEASPSPTVTTSTAVKTPAATPTVDSSDPVDNSTIGIDFDTAEKNGVLAADGDANLLIDSISDMNGFVVEGRVKNISKVDETYDVVLLTASGGTDSRMSLNIPAGEIVPFKLTSDSVEVVGVRLDSKLLGEGVAESDWGHEE